MLKLFILFALLTGCAGTQQGVKAPPVIKLGIIESITPIEMDDSSGAGAMAGGIFGQVGGGNTGAGRGGAVGSVLGSVLGGTLGQQAGIATRPGLELWVKLDGEEQSTYVMQPGKPGAFTVGERVRVVQKQGTLRVEAVPPTPAPPAPAQ